MERANGEEEIIQESELEQHEPKSTGLRTIRAMPSRARRAVSKRHEHPDEERENDRHALNAPLVPEDLDGSPVVLSREEHSISRKRIDSDALKVLYRLHNHGYKAYLVGGGVRDLLLQRTPKDFDVSTDARPEEVRSLFRNSRVIGRRFRMNHVYFFGNKIIEVSTFRDEGGSFDPEEEPTKVKADNVYGTPETDARRRDLTINGLFYDVATFSVIDYVGGIEDLNNKIIRIIGEPEVRIKEDPVRMIRAVRHAARTGFNFDPATFNAIKTLPHLIEICPKVRVFEEFTRELRGGFASRSVPLMEETGLLRHLLPELAEALETRGDEVRPHLEEVLRRIDQVILGGHELSPAVVFLAISFDSFNADRFDEDSDVQAHIEQLFHPVGVSRKERERMEQIITLRQEILQASASERRTKMHIADRHGFAEALDLIMLTASDSVRERCFDRWGPEFEGPRHGGQRRGGGSGGNGGGGRRRRRRGGGGGRQRGPR